MEKKINGTGNDFILSRYGVRIRKVCASCKWKCFEGELCHRLCLLSGRRVESGNSCRHWKLTEGRDDAHSLMNAGKGGGRVMTPAEIDRNRRRQQRLYDERARERRMRKDNHSMLPRK